MNEVLADLVIGTLVFAETAGDEEVHPDTAVKLMEWYMYELERLDPTDRLWLCERTRVLAAGYSAPAAKRVLESLASQLMEEPD